MLYCFVQEDLQSVLQDDSLILQSNYAKAINKYCCCSIKYQTVKDAEGAELSSDHEPIFLRSSCPLTLPAQEILMQKGFVLLEKPDDLQQILHWDTLKLCERPIVSCTCDQLISGKTTEVITDLLNNDSSAVFLKTRSKGLHAVVSSSRLIHPDESFIHFIRQKCAPVSSELLLSPYLSLCKDSLGNKESRHIVINGKILNSSRNIYALKHAVPRSLLIKAEQIVSEISKNQDFPQNYVLDLGEFENNSQRFIDIVELNPISNSLCYCNNSIFDLMLPEIESVFFEHRFGYEYCLDYLSNPNRYTLERAWGESNEYYDSETYSFL